MGIIEKVKAFFAVKKLLKEATLMEGTKPGWQTTEFWGKTIVQLVVIFNALSAKDIPVEAAASIVAILEGLYIGGRSLAKAVKDIALAWKGKTPA